MSSNHSERSSSNLDSLSDTDLCQWCVHSMKVDSLGLPTADSLAISLEKVLNKDVKAIVFLDLDETLTKENLAPEEFFEEMLEEDEKLTDAHVKEYMLDRVPSELRKRIKKFIAKLDAMNGVVWFILTDNIFSMARCTMKLAFDVETEPGTIIDRDLRTNTIQGHEIFMDKRNLIESFILSRAEEGLPPVKVVFVDNWDEHRKEVALTLNATDPAYDDFNQEEKMKTRYLKDTPSFICCDDLENGMTSDHIDQVLAFLNE